MNVPATIDPAPSSWSAERIRLKRFRVQVFASTWASYAGYYFCRRAFYAVKSDLTQEVGIDSATLGQIEAVYLIAYAIGEFNAAVLGTRFGARRLVLSGMAISAACNVVFGFANNAWTFMAFMALNGLAQATGWSGNIGTMAQWFHRKERGRVMAFWATCYQLGGAMAQGFAGFILGLWGWHWSFFGASMVLGCVWLAFYTWQRNRPEDVGLPAVTDEQPEPTDVPSQAATSVRASANRQLIVTILMMGSFYFFIKLIRYALWSWAPYFLRLNFGIEKAAANYYSILFDLFGFFGVLAAGFASDKLTQGRRAPVIVVMMFGLVMSTLFLWGVGVVSVFMFVVAIALVGFTLYGPDSLISGAGAIDAASRKHALIAAGVINGMGSIGAVVQALFIGDRYKRDPTDLGAVLLLLTAAAGVATVMILLLWRRARAGKCNL